MPEDLKINVGVGGAKEAEIALKGVAAAEQGVGQAAGAGAGKMAEAAKGGVAELSGGIELGRREITMMATAMGDLGLRVPGLNSVLATLLSGAINPVTLGFAAAMLAVQGLVAIIGASAATHKEEQERLERLAETYAKVADAIETVIQKRRTVSFAGAVAAEKEVFDVAAAGGVTVDQAGGLMEAAAGTTVDTQQAMAAWRSPDVPESARKDWKTYIRWFRRQGPARQQTLAAAGAEVAKQLPSASQKRAAAIGAAGAAAEITPEMRMQRDFAAWADISPEDAATEFAFARPRAAFTLPPALVWDIAKRREEARAKIRRFAEATGHSEAIEGLGPGSLGGSPGLTINAGVYYAAPGADPAGQIPRNARK